ncbi:MAG TPA: SGNH/GDSL hydrolase family protein [Candidatus Saccharimonadales bacterium]
MKWLKCLLALCVLLISQFVAVGSSYAASGYDSVIKTGGTAVVTNNWSASGGVCGARQPLTEDLGGNWDQYVLDSDRYLGSAATSSQKSAAISAFQSALDNSSGWALVQNVAWQDYASVGGADMKSGDTYLTVYFSNDNTATFNTTSNVDQLIIGGSWYALRISYAAVGSDCQVGITQIVHDSSSAYYEPLQSASNLNEKSIFINFDITYPAGYEGKAAPTKMPPAKYVAMGDSFSSGEGSPPFEFGTDTINNTCHRSPQAYSRLLQNDSSLSLGTAAFVACSGAKVSNVLNGSWNEPAQINALSENTEIATITIGGNDMKFSDFAYACVYGSCNSSSSEYLESWGIMTDVTRSDYLPSRLATLFSNMESRLWLNTDVKVYVVGYPHIITQASWADRGIGICSDFDQDEAIAAENIVSKLNDVIQTAVTDFDDSRFVYVDPLETGSPFLGHELCRGGAYFNGTEAGLSNPVYVFHPNANGQQAYAELIKSHMS